MATFIGAAIIGGTLGLKLAAESKGKIFIPEAIILWT
jgi:hypothetical protein